MSKAGQVQGGAAGVHGLLAALVFFTRLPVRRWYRHSPQAAVDAAVFAPLAGALVGLISGVVLVTSALVLPALVAACLALAAAALLTGALHEDAFADYCDGFGAGGNAERIVEIMRDPRCGAFGVTGLGLLLLTEAAALAALCEAMLGAGQWLTLILALATVHAGSRLAAVAFMFFASHVQAAHSKIAEAARQVPRARLPVAVVPVLVLLIALAWSPLPWLVLLALAWPLAAWLLGARFLPVLGGYTGDCLGAVQKLAEALGIVAACALARWAVGV